MPIFDKKRVIAVRAAVNRYQPDNGSTVPFYYVHAARREKLNPRLRGLPLPRPERRAGERGYRWEALSGVDMAVFYDAGTVAPRWNHLTLAQLKQSWGIGLRFNTYKSVFMRMEAAFGQRRGLAAVRRVRRASAPQRYLR